MNFSTGSISPVVRETFSLSFHNLWMAPSIFIYPDYMWEEEDEDVGELLQVLRLCLTP